MENFNKIFSFVLGLVVVVVFLAVLTGKIDLKKRFFDGNGVLSNINKNKNTATPTPTASYVKIKTETAIKTNQYQTQAKEIPSTGLPTIVLPTVFSSLLTGIYLSKKR